MSSAFRSQSNTKNLPLNTYVSGPTYVNPNFQNIGTVPALLFPFNYLKNGVLELVPDESFIQIHQENYLFPGYNNLHPVRLLGGHHMVTDIGPLLKNYISVIYNNKYNTAGGVSSVNVYQPGVVTKAQTLDAGNLGSTLFPDNANPTDAQSGDSSRPPNATYTMGTSANLWFTTYVFTSPLTLKITFNTPGNARYFTFKSGVV